MITVRCGTQYGCIVIIYAIAFVILVVRGQYDPGSLNPARFQPPITCYKCHNCPEDSLEDLLEVDRSRFITTCDHDALGCLKVSYVYENDKMNPPKMEGITRGCWTPKTSNSIYPHGDNIAPVAGTSFCYPSWKRTSGVNYGQTSDGQSDLGNTFIGSACICGEDLCNDGGTVKVNFWVVVGFIVVCSSFMV